MSTGALCPLSFLRDGAIGTQVPQNYLLLRYPIVRILLAIAAIYGLKIHQMNVMTAFLAGELEKEIFMEQPEGFEVGTTEDDLIYRLRRSLYGLKQTPRV